MAILAFNSVPAQEVSFTDLLKDEMALFQATVPTERYTVLNPNGGLRTEVRELAWDDEAQSPVSDEPASVPSPHSSS